MQTRSIWVLVIVSCCAALVALAFVYVSFTQAREWFAANPHCISPFGDFLPVLPMIEKVRTTWLIWIAAGLLSWCCTFAARRSASASTRGAQRIAAACLWLSSLALVACALFFGGFELTCYGLRIA